MIVMPIEVKKKVFCKVCGQEYILKKGQKEWVCPACGTLNKVE